MLVGGFPCQSFSTAGFQQGLNDHQTANGRLYLEVCRLVCATHPKAFLLENVANLYIMDGGQWHEDVEQRKPGTTFITILTALETCGYTVRTRVVNAASHGVPQHRDRLFFVGFLDARTMDRFEWPQYHCHPEEDAATSPPPTLGSILECDDSVSVQAAALTRDQYERVQQWLDPLLSAGRSCRAARLDGIARTLMASYRSGWHKHSEFVVSPISHDSARFYTAREAARIMGFPDGYLIPGHPTRDHGGTTYDEYHRFYHQIGNAVCPPVVKALASSMMSAMNIGNQKDNR
jgi:DNA (cytosine-5)-methyltransferase 1